MNRGIKLALGGLLGLVVLLIIAVVLVVLLVDLNRFKPQIEQAVQQQTGRTLRIEGDLGWSLYPVLGIELGQTQLSNAPGFDDKPMASIKQVSVGVALLPLLKGNLGVSELVLEAPEIYLARKADGTTNWDDLIQKSKTEPEPTPEQPAEESQPLQIAIEGVRLTDAQIEWHDEQNQQSVRIAPLTLITGPIEPGKPTDIQLQLAVANQNPQVDATLNLQTRVASAEDFSWVEWQDLILRLEAKGEAIPAELAKADLSSSGRLYLQEQTLNLQQTTLKFQVPGLNKTMNAEGELSLALQGNLETQTFSSQAVTLDALVTGKDLPGGKAEISLQTPVTLDLKQQTLSLPAVVANALGIKLNATVTGKQILDDPQLQGTLNVAQFAPKPLLQRLGVELPAMSDETALQSLSLSTQFNATPKLASLSKLKVVLDESNLTGTAQAGLGEKTDLGFKLALDKINLDRYLPPAAAETSAPEGSKGSDKKAPPASKTPTTASQEPAADPFAWMDQINLDGNINVGQVQVKGAKITDIQLNVVARDQILTVDPLVASLYGGRQSTRVRVDTSGPEPKTQVHTAVQTVNVGTLLNSIMSQAPLEGTGSLDLNLNLTGLSLDQIQRSLQGGGELRINDGAFNGVSILSSLRNNLAALSGKPAQETKAETELKNFLAKFQIDGGSLNWREMNSKLGDVALSADGGFNLFTQELDTLLKITVPESFKSKNDLLSRLAGQQIPIKLGGTLTDPKLGSVDLKNAITAQVQEKIDTKVQEKREEVQKKVDEKLQKGLEKLFKR